MRKRVLLALVSAAALAALVIPTVGSAAPAQKVQICHVNGSTGVAPFGPVNITFGRIIEVSPNAVDAHYAHGDGYVQFTPDNANLWAYGESLGVIGNGNCAFNVPIGP